MPEKDNLDRMLESSLSNYGEPESGLAERILARVESEQKLAQPTPKWRGRILLWAALPVAACLLLTLLVLKSSGPTVTHPPNGLPESASTSTGSKAPSVENVTRPAPKTRARTPLQNSRTVAGSAARPKLDVFPLPQPLTPEEKALYAFATQVPEKERQAIMAAQKDDDAPLNVAALQIQPLEILDTGKN